MGCCKKSIYNHQNGVPDIVHRQTSLGLQPEESWDLPGGVMSYFRTGLFPSPVVVEHLHSSCIFYKSRVNDILDFCGLISMDID
jgi:hypothetical protein